MSNQYKESSTNIVPTPAHHHHCIHSTTNAKNSSPTLNIMSYSLKKIKNFAQQEYYKFMHVL